MLSQEIHKRIKALPDAPGVYLFKRGQGSDARILYVGKATSLRDRVRSYFNADVVNTRSPLISKMLGEFETIEHIKTDSVLEALVLEAFLIKKYQPEANIKEKDNKSFNYVIITKEDFPRVMVVRGRELAKFVEESSREEASERDGARLSQGLARPMAYSLRDVPKKDFDVLHSFGPFPNGSQLREALKIVRKMFPYRDKCTPASELRPGQKAKPCFNCQIGLCPGVCSGAMSQAEYAERIENIVLFFEGNKKKIIKNLEREMKDFSKHQEFEKAGAAKRTLFTLNHIQDVALIKDESKIARTSGELSFRIESYDIAHLSGTNVVGVMTVVEGGEVRTSEYRKFKIRESPGVNDTKALSEILTRRLAHIEWRSPDLIVVDGGVAQKRAMEKVLREHGENFPVVSVVKDDHHKPKEILGDKKFLIHEREILLSNAEAHRYAISFHKLLRGKIK